MVKRYLTLMFFVVCDVLSVIFSLGISLVLNGESFFNSLNGIIELSYLILVFSVVFVVNVGFAVEMYLLLTHACLLLACSYFIFANSPVISMTSTDSP